MLISLENLIEKLGGTMSFKHWKRKLENLRDKKASCVARFIRCMYKTIFYSRGKEDQLLVCD